MKKVSQSAAGRAHVERARHRQRVVLVGQRVFGIAAAGQQRGDRVADLPGRAAGADGGDLAGDLEARQVRGVRGRRVGAAALLHVGPVDAGRADADQDLAGRRPRHRADRRTQHLGAAGLGDLDHPHLGGQAHAARRVW